MEQQAQFGTRFTDISVNGSVFVQNVTPSTKLDMTTFILTGPNISSVPVGGPSPTSVQVLVTLMAFVTIVGFISNTATFITLIKDAKGKQNVYSNPKLYNNCKSYLLKIRKVKSKKSKINYLGNYYLDS